MSSPGTNLAGSNVPIIARWERLGWYGAGANSIDELHVDSTDGRSKYQAITVICTLRQADYEDVLKLVLTSMSS